MKTEAVYLYGEVGKDITLRAIINQLKGQPFDALDVHIHSVGGSVTEGFAIYDYLRSLKKPVATYIDGVCYSIATIIALAAGRRVISPNGEIIIHNPFVQMMTGDSAALAKNAKELADTEQRMVSVYRSATKADPQTIESKMQTAAVITASEALSLGFVTEIAHSLKAVAKIDLNQPNPMNDSKLKKLFRSMFNLAKSAGIDAYALVLQDANGAEIDFPDLSEGETPKEGDKATIDGKPAEGDVTMPDGSVYTFKEGVLTTIKAAEPATEPPTDEPAAKQIDALAKELKELKAANAKKDKEIEVMKSQVSAVCKEFNEVKGLIGSTYQPDTKTDAHDKKTETSRKLFK